MTLLSRPMVGEAAEYHSACANTLRRSRTVTTPRLPRETLAAVHPVWGVEMGLEHLKAPPVRPDNEGSPTVLRLLIYIVLFAFVWGFFVHKETKVTPAHPEYAESMPPAATVHTVEDQAKQVQRDQEARAASLVDKVTEQEGLLVMGDGQIKDKTVNFTQMGVVDGFLEIIDNAAAAIQRAEAEQSTLTPEQVRRVKMAKAKISALQKRLFPQMRAAYRKTAADALWEHDIEVSVKGTGNTTITFFGFWFASNANIKASEQQLDATVSRLRYKKIQFAAYREAQRGAGYGLNTPADGVIKVSQ